MRICDLGIVEYREAVCIQEEMLAKRIAGEIPDILILAQHYPVVTFGRLREEKDIVNKKFFSERKIPVFLSGRGGKITYHAPGQLLLYPIIDLKEKKRNLAFYLDFLEKVIVKSLKCFSVPAERSNKERGVWVSGKKIAFVGISLKNWVTFHGVAVNINNDTTPFLHMNPCGEKDIKVISARQYLGNEFDINEVKKVFIEQFIESLEIEYGTIKQGAC